MNQKRKIIIVMCVSLLIMIVGYAAFSTQLKINGTANIESNWNVVFTKIEKISSTSGVTEKSTPTASGTTATFNVNLKSPGDAIEYQITVENKGTLDAIIENIEASELGSDAFKFKISNIKKGDKLAKSSTTTFKVKIRFDESVTSQPTLPDNELRVNIKYVQDIGQTITSESNTIKVTRLSQRILQDNTAQADTNIDFSKISSDTNGKGLYYTSTNTEGNKRTYYFRGAVNNNYVKLGSMYFRIVRINEDGSVRLIYQGMSANATGISSQIKISSFNSNPGDNAFGGYMHAKPTTYKDGIGIWNGGSGYWTRLATSSTVKMATTYSFDDQTGEYTLTSPVDGKYTSTYYNYYTCMSTTGVTCKLIVKLTSAREKDGYNELKGGEFHSGYFSTSYEQAHKNEVDSDVKKVIDNWYKNNLTIYNSLIADSGFCNDRSLYSGTGLGRAESYYGAAGRNYFKKAPQFSCPNEERDLFTTTTSTKGNKALTYPVGLITADEVAYAGGVYGIDNNSYYLCTNTLYWTMSPFNLYSVHSNISGWEVRSIGVFDISTVSNRLGVRPVINLKANVEITSGDGTSGSPYVIKTN